jgi:NADPH:quinone reductase-like Zn-dependent oxidoreductase
MKAIVQERYGPPDVLELREVGKPVPADGEVLVRVRAAALNAYDWHFLHGDPYLARLSMGVRRPSVRIRGRDFAGQVEAVGPNVTDLAPGDEVYGEADGAFAEYLCVRADMVERKPANLTFEEAAAIPLAGNTALIGVRDLGRARPGQQLLVNGASGGVGPFAIQIAKSLGANVTAVCSARNAELVRSLGADRIIDYQREDFTRDGRRYDVIFDLVGNRSLAECRRALAPEGTLILSGGGVYRGGSMFGPMRLILAGMMLSRFVHYRLLVLSARPGRANLAALRELAESGKITPVIERTYPLSEVPEALRYLEVEHARTKVVITI